MRSAKACVAYDRPGGEDDDAMSEQARAEDVERVNARLGQGWRVCGCKTSVQTGTENGYMCPWHRDRYLAACTAAEARGREAGQRLYEQIERSEIRLPADWACKECRPDSDMLLEGFQCGYHAVRAATEPAP